MVRERNAGYEEGGGGMEWQALPETAVWSEYDGDTIYGDYTIDPTTGSEIEKTAYLAGVGQVDVGTGAVMYHHADHLGTTRATSDGTGALSAPAVYTAFGENARGLGGTRYQYAGAWGYETGMLPGSSGIPGLPWQHVGHRWYDPSTGRFLQRDPIGIEGGLNVYEYVRARPTAATDPTGLMSPPIPGMRWPKGMRQAPGVTPQGCCRWDTDWFDLASTGHFLIPFLLCSCRFPPYLVMRGAYEFEFVEQNLFRAFGRANEFWESEENQTADIYLGWLGALLGWLWLASDMGAGRVARRPSERRRGCFP
jgi:RHS repeat-associated protein